MRTTSTKYNEIYEPWDVDEARAYDHMRTVSGSTAELGYSHVDRQPDHTWSASNYSHIDDSHLQSGEFESDDRTFGQSLITHEQTAEAEVEYGNTNTVCVELHRADTSSSSSSGSSPADSSYDLSSVRNIPKNPKHIDSSYDQMAVPPNQESQLAASRKPDSYDHSNLTAVPLRTTQLASPQMARQTYDHATLETTDQPTVPKRPPKPTGYDQSSTGTRYGKAVPQLPGYDKSTVPGHSKSGHAVPQVAGYDTSTVKGGARPKQTKQPSAGYDKSTFVSGARPKQRIPSASGYDQSTLSGSSKTGRAVQIGYDQSTLPGSLKSGKVRPNTSGYDKSTLKASARPKHNLPGYDRSTLPLDVRPGDAHAEVSTYDECAFIVSEDDDTTKSYVQSYSIITPDDEDSVKTEVRPRFSLKHQDVSRMRPEEEVTQTMQVFENIVDTADESAPASEESASRFKENRANLMAKFAIKDDSEQPKDGRHDYFVLEKIGK